MNTFLNMPRKTFFLILFLIAAIAILSLILFIRQPKEKTSQPEPRVSYVPLVGLKNQRSTIGVTTKDQFRQNNPDAKEQVLGNNLSKYMIPSAYELRRPNEVIFQNNTAIFERIVLAGSQTETDFMNISDQVLKFGFPEAILPGSTTFGYHIRTYIYPDLGLAFLANRFTEEVFEIQIFPPTTLDDYLIKYGQDIAYTDGSRNI